MIFAPLAIMLSILSGFFLHLEASRAQCGFMQRNYAYPQHLISLDGLGPQDIERLFEHAQSYYQANKKSDKKATELKGLTHINLFFEPSTRTRSSFELAGKRLGMDVINIASNVSATQKGESLIDTAQTLSAMQPDIIVMRHPQSGAAELFADFIKCKLINGGDGAHQHPTQALLDAFTIHQHKGGVKGLKVAICGDIAHSRVARSNLTLLKMLGAKVTLVAPPQFMPSQPETLDCELAHRLEDGIAGADVVMMLRVQKERISSSAFASMREYFHLYGLSHAKLVGAKPDVLVMHPGPINRGMEIETRLADDIERNAILDQVEAGVAMRMAVLVDMLKEK